MHSCYKASNDFIYIELKFCVSQVFYYCSGFVFFDMMTISCHTTIPDIFIVVGRNGHHSKNDLFIFFDLHLYLFKDSYRKESDSKNSVTIVSDTGFPGRGGPTPEDGAPTYYLAKCLPKTA